MLGGGGMLNLSASNGYSGGTTVSGGTLQLGNTSALATGGLTADAGSVDLAGYSPTVFGLGGAAGTITNSVSSAVTLTANQATPTTFGGALQDGCGTLSLVKNGTGALWLTGTNTYSGGTTLNGGTLAITNASSLGAAGGEMHVGEERTVGAKVFQTRDVQVRTIKPHFS